MAAILSLRNVRVRYDATTALDGLSFEVACGEIVALLGPNGSGKSTALAVAAGLLEPATGRVFVAGMERRSDPNRYAVQIGYVPQDAALYDELGAEQNLEILRPTPGLARRRLGCPRGPRPSPRQTHRTAPPTAFTASPEA